MRGRPASHQLRTELALFFEWPDVLIPSAQNTTPTPTTPRKDPVSGERALNEIRAPFIHRYMPYHDTQSLVALATHGAPQQALLDMLQRKGRNEASLSYSLQLIQGR